MRTYYRENGKLRCFDVGTNDPAEAIAEVRDATHCTAMAVCDPRDPPFIPNYRPQFGIHTAVQA